MSKHLPVEYEYITDHGSLSMCATGVADEGGNRTSTCTVPACSPAPESQSHGLSNHQVILPVAERLVVPLVLRDADEVLECLSAGSEEHLDPVLQELSELDGRDLDPNQHIVPTVARWLGQS
jgi:hypothetical protein